MSLSRRLLVFALACVFLILTLTHRKQIPVPSRHSLGFWKPKILDESLLRGPADETLGFDALVAVSAPNSPRRTRLMQAANVTELNITIPDLPFWSDYDVGNFTDKLEWGGRESGRGSILAWLSHTHILRWFLESDLETILIFEDDVDWDIHLRTVQIPRAAAATRKLLGPATSYWGDANKWDVLWLGHCGDWFDKLEYGLEKPMKSPENLTSRPHVTYSDPALPMREFLHPFTAKFLAALELPEQTRAIHASGYPLCTFGYAVNRRSARTILDSIAPITRPESSAFDAAMLLGCRKRGLKCFTVNPELFHHVQGDSIIAVTEKRKKIFLPPVDAEGLKQTQERNETSNIGCGFVSGDFRFDDEEKMMWLREEVGRKGRCLKPTRDWTPFDMDYNWEDD